MQTDISRQTRTPLLDALRDYHANEVFSFDVPGHKKNDKLKTLSHFFGSSLLNYDANSMKALDNLSNPTGVIKEAEDLYASLYQYDEAHFLINGATVGVQAMILATCSPGDKILVPRNVHKSVINALILSAAEPVYIYPEMHPEIGIATTVSLSSIKRAIDTNQDAKTLFLVHPSYYGICCELEAITAYAHANGMVVIVDEAHGAHLPFSEELPLNAFYAGADLSTISVHKTGGALTQAAVLLVNKERMDSSRVKGVLNMLQSTSASYLLMASLDAARCELALYGELYLREALQLARFARETLNEIEGLYVAGKELTRFPEVEDVDETKLVMHTTELGLSGFEFYDLLREEYHIQLELADACNAMALLSIGDKEEEVMHLISSIQDLASRYRKKPFSVARRFFDVPELVLSPREAFYARTQLLPIREAVGQISAEILTLYPPGIPIVMPGERLTRNMIEYLHLLKNEKGMLVDLADPKAEQIKVVI